MRALVSSRDMLAAAQRAAALGGAGACRQPVLLRSAAGEARKEREGGLTAPGVPRETGLVTHQKLAIGTTRASRISRAAPPRATRSVSGSAHAGVACAPLVRVCARGAAARRRARAARRRFPQIRDFEAGAPRGDAPWGNQAARGACRPFLVRRKPCFSCFAWPCALRVAPRSPSTSETGARAEGGAERDTLRRGVAVPQPCASSSAPQRCTSS
jgi:hypothetical protein